MQGALTANNPGVWCNLEKEGKLPRGSDISAETQRIGTGVSDGWGVEGGSERKTGRQGRGKNLLKGLRREET